MKVLKFGGSSVAQADRIMKVLNILQDLEKKNEQYLVVFSAFGGVTDLLLDAGAKAAIGDEHYIELVNTFKERHYTVIEALLEGEFKKDAINFITIRIREIENILKGIFLIRERTKKSSDYLASFGERSSTYIISQVLKQHNSPVVAIDARDLICTNDEYGSASVLWEKTNTKMNAFFSSQPSGQNFTMTGFIGATENNFTTTLGRGGSDYTAAIMGAHLNASVIEIWTDVDGVMTADPRKVPTAFTIPSLTYAEAMEISHFGAKVIYPPTIRPALDKNILLSIRNTFNPSFEGTTISNTRIGHQDNIITGVTSISKAALLTLQGCGMFGVSGIAARMFDALAKEDINLTLITQGSSEHSICCAISPNDIEKAALTINEAFSFEINKGLIDEVIIEENLSVIAIVGENMRHQSGMAGKLFQALGKNGINVVAIAQGSSELNISVIVSKNDEVKALNAIHESFFLSDTQSIHLFMVGVGLIGKSLLSQIEKQRQYLLDTQRLNIKVVALANTKKMIFNDQGIDINNWQEALQNSEETSNLKTFMDKMISMNLQNSIFVDNTANPEIIDFYEEILKASISISTPNKIGASSTYAQYVNFNTLAAKNNVKFLYETNVGAGLPVISTLNNLIYSGDKVLKIEGVLSGSLSFIFNNFTKEISFHDIVKEAQQLGYTEPDPRQDLSGLDVRRKLLILARESGIPLEPTDVVITDVLPQDSLEAPTIDSFFESLKTNESTFNTMIQEAATTDKRLRFIATLENGVGTIALKAVGTENPFYNLSGSDNMIVFTTERYKERPLVVRGPGAGAEVTAAGVFAEIISIANYLS